MNDYCGPGKVWVRPWRGFSLVELVVVLGIVAVSGALVMPHVSRLAGGNRLERLHDQIGRLCQETFFRAIFSGQPQRIARTADGFLDVRDVAGSRIASMGQFLRPLPIPDWSEIEWPPSGWRAEPEGWCDEGPIALRDRDSGDRVVLRFRPFDAEPLPLEAATP